MRFVVSSNSPRLALAKRRNDFYAIDESSFNSPLQHADKCATQGPTRMRLPGYGVYFRVLAPSLAGTTIVNGAHTHDKLLNARVPTQRRECFDAEGAQSN